MSFDSLITNSVAVKINTGQVESACGNVADPGTFRSTCKRNILHETPMKTFHDKHILVKALDQAWRVFKACPAEKNQIWL